MNTITPTTPIIPFPTTPSVSLFLPYKTPYVGVAIVAQRPSIKITGGNWIEASSYFPRCIRVNDDIQYRFRNIVTNQTIFLPKKTITDQILFHIMEFANGIYKTEFDLTATPIPPATYDVSFIETDATGATRSISFSQRYAVT
ncbi:hypothetical protein [Pseudomonas sp. LF245]